MTLGIQAAPVGTAWAMRATTFAFAATAPTRATGYASIERGRYLAGVGDCASCHTETGGKPYAGGRAVLTPFGTIYSINITPDAATGIDKWPMQDFYKGLHDGIRRDGKHHYLAVNLRC